MCFFYRQSKEATKLVNRFNARFKREMEEMFRTGDFSGFTHPRAAVITDDEPEQIQLFDWGLIPFWSKDKDIQKYTLNARIETIKEKPSFRNSANKRCLIPAEGFYEWQWLDAKGKQKQKYFISKKDEEMFAFGGLHSTWTDQQTGEIVNTFTILTQEANPLMAEIHNSKKRMPLILQREIEFDWLSGKIDIEKVPDVDLDAKKI